MHQGGGCSTYYFLLCTEVLALNIRAHPDIKGIVMEQIEYLLGQYADDMDICMANDENSIKGLVNTLEWF